MLDEPAKLIYNVLDRLGIDVFAFLAVLCIGFLILLRKNIKNWSQTKTIDKISVVLLLILVIFFGVLFIISP